MRVSDLGGQAAPKNELSSLSYRVSLNRGGPWDATDDFRTSFLHFICLCSPLPSGTWRTQGLPIPWCSLPSSFSVCLVFFPFSLCHERWFWPDLMNRKHVHTTLQGTVKKGRKQGRLVNSVRCQGPKPKHLPTTISFDCSHALCHCSYSFERELTRLPEWFYSKNAWTSSSYSAIFWF